MSRVGGLGDSAIRKTPSQDVGTYEWDQVISNDSYSYTVGKNTTTCNGPVGLDNGIPTLEGFMYSDSPGRGLPPTDNEFTWSWNFTVYLMWNPGLTNISEFPLAMSLGAFSRMWFRTFRQTLGLYNPIAAGKLPSLPPALRTLRGTAL